MNWLVPETARNETIHQRNRASDQIDQLRRGIRPGQILQKQRGAIGAADAGGRIQIGVGDIGSKAVPRKCDAAPGSSPGISRKGDAVVAFSQREQLAPYTQTRALPAAD